MTDTIDYRNLKPHPLAKLFPKYGADDLKTLVEDIGKHGLHNKIMIFEGKILDGVNRYSALKELGLFNIEGRFHGQTTSDMFERLDPYTDREAVDYVVSLNLNRRHLTDDQRAVIAAKLANIPHGGARRIKPPIGGLKIADAADKMKVSKRSAERAKAVLNQDPGLADEVGDGTKTLAAATKEAAMKKTETPPPPPPPPPLSPALVKAIKVLVEQHGFEAVRDAVLDYVQ